jgi:hypothetical protein
MGICDDFFLHVRVSKSKKKREIIIHEKSTRGFLNVKIG